MHDFQWFALVVVPILIFLARIMDVSIDTMRVIFISRGYKFLAAFCGFVEVLIWLVVITQIFRNLTNPIYYIAYAAGFATGNYVGMFIEEHLALGNVLIRVITRNELTALYDDLRDRGFGVTVISGQGLYGSVKILFSIIPRSELDEVVATIREVNPQAFYTIEDIRFVTENDRSHRSTTFNSWKLNIFRRSSRKGR